MSQHFEDAFFLRQDMVNRQLRARGIRDERVLKAMADVPRHEFIEGVDLGTAYGDHPVAIGHRQTISQPYIVALMTELVRPTPAARILDVGTGSGYQAAVLAEIVDHVYTVEIVPELAAAAKCRLDGMGFQNVSFRTGDAFEGWPEAAPFDGIIAAAAPAEIPKALIEQLAPGGRLVIPIGSYLQRLVVVTKHIDGTITHEDAGGVAFVRMTGQAEQHG
ncbi:MAG: protein-L-isoaspartate(D-aspartate) O-methyltransferase [Planctomycetota bacterium]|jgi:protein-L-isoaspartate(D-aspartate) O-methyltransferase